VLDEPKLKEPGAALITSSGSGNKIVYPFGNLVLKTLEA
jgi:hypothetical protein